MSSRELEAQKLQKEWSDNPRWRGIKRGYTAAEVVRLRGSEDQASVGFFLAYQFD